MFTMFRRCFFFFDVLVCFAAEGVGESADAFENRLFEQTGQADNSFFGKLDGSRNSFRRQGAGSGMGDWGRPGGRGNSEFGDREGSLFGGSMDDSLNDGMNEKLDNAARTFHMTDEVEEDDYDFRPDVNYRRGSTYNVKVRGIPVHHFNGSSTRSSF
jgi:hypothetical protein